METTPARHADEVAWIDTAQMVEVDRVMIGDLHIELVTLRGDPRGGGGELHLAHISVPPSVAPRWASPRSGSDRE